jgi:hypothetical protein
MSSVDVLMGLHFAIPLLGINKDVCGDRKSVPRLRSSFISATASSVDPVNNYDMFTWQAVEPEIASVDLLRQCSRQVR